MQRNLLTPSKYWTDRFGNTVLNVFEKLDAPVDPQKIEAFHKLKSDNNGILLWSRKFIVKFSKLRDMVWVINRKKSLKTSPLGGTGLLHALHYLQILAFAVTTSICGLNVKHYGLVN